MKIDEDGNELVAETVIRSATQSGALPDVAVDSNDNVHVVWADYGDTQDNEIYYMMLNGSDGSTLIDATRLTPDDNEESERARIVVDFEDKVHITFHDWRGYSEELYYTKLDPSQDDQNGNAANEPTITVIDDTALTPDDGNSSRPQAMAIECGRYIHITWYEYDTDDNIHYMVLDNDGNVVLADTALSTTGQATSSTAWTLPYLEVDANGKAHVTWCDYRTGDYEVWYTTHWRSFTLTVNKAGTGTGTVTSAPAGINCGVDCTEKYGACQVVTLTATADADSAFTGWSGDCSGTNPTTTVPMDADKTCTATFTSYTLTVNTVVSGDASGRVTSDPAGINCGADCTGNYPPDTVVTLTAHPGVKSYLASWSGDCDANGQVTMDGDKTCIATFGYPVGGIVVPVDKLGLVAPWMGLAALALLVALGVVLVRRREN